MELGSGRLVAQEVFRDVTRTFTGGQARWKHVGQDSVTAFAVLPVLTLPDDRDGLLRTKIRRDREHLNLTFWGGIYENPHWWGSARAEGYVYRLDERDDPGVRETRDRHIWTVGARVFKSPVGGAADAEVEAAGQTGRARATSVPADRRDLDVAAGYLHASGGYTLHQRWSPRLGAEYDYGSGDADPTDGKWNRFDSLFGNRRVDLGPPSIYGALGRENINTLGVRASVAPNSRVDAFAVCRLVRLAAAKDAFASTGVRDAAGLSGTDGGRQVDVRVRAWIVPGVIRVEDGTTRLFTGRFLRDAPNATREGDTSFFYADVTYTVRGD